MGGSQAANHQPPITIAATATAVPEFKLAREELKEYLKVVFSLDEMRLNALMSIVDNSQVKQRYIILPVEHVIKPRPLAQITQEYQEHAIKLGRQVAVDCLARAGMEPKDIDLLITVSCTGVIIPSLDAHLINELGFRSDVRRLPITELGCAAGAAALSHSRQFIRAFPGSNVLVVAVEIPSMTFQRGDLNQANLISTVLFGDGAAATVVKGAPGPGPQILDAHTHTFPNTTTAMGFDLKETGFHIVLSRDVPELIRSHIKGLLKAFLGRNGLTQDKIGAFLMHPGGQKLLLYVQEELGLCECDTQLSWDVLREYGNLSSASVLFVLHECLKKLAPKPGDYGLMAAFGPGFSAEMLLLQWA
jgi:alkylresorcinol/alkylpyrone synthase